MYKPHPTPYSPVSGEYEPHADLARLEQDFIEVADNQINVGANPFEVGPVSEEPIRQVAMSEEHGIYMNMHPQTLTLSPETTVQLEQMMHDWFRHYPIEPSYARAKFDSPMLLTRFDGTITPDGQIGLCEYDDVPTGFNALKSINPIAASWAQKVADSLGETLHSTFLPETDYEYPHDDHRWLPSTNGHHIPGVPVIPRARRVAPGFDEFMDMWGDQSIVGAWERDNKGPLIGMKLGALAASPAVAIELADKFKSDKPIFMKALSSSRTEAAGVVASNKWRKEIPGSGSVGQIVSKLGRAGIALDADMPMVLQPFHRPPTMAEIGLSFRENDADTVRAFSENMRNFTGADLMTPGNEHRYHVLSRIYGAYVPGEGHKIVGGFWMARPNAAIIHGSSDAIAGAVLVKGLEAA